jgi:hypothetical protein
VATDISLIDHRKFSVARCLPPEEHGINTSKSGAPRSGKDLSDFPVMTEWANRGLGPQLHLHPDPGENVPKKANYLHAHRAGGKVVIDSADKPDQSLGICVLKPSEHPHDFQRVIDDNNSAESFVETGLRGREGRSEWHPLLQEGLLYAARLVLRQPRPVQGVKTLLSVGKFHNRHFRKALDEVQCDDTYWYWKAFEKATGQARAGLSAIIRNIHLNWDHPQFLWRDSDRDTTDDLIADGWTVLLEGSETDRVTTNLFRLKIRKLYDLAARLYQLRGGLTHIRLVIDEWGNFGLIGESEVSKIARGNKHGVSTTLISQSFDSGDPSLNRKLAQLMQRKEAFRAAGYEEAIDQARFIFTPALDPLAVHYVEERFRSEIDYRLVEYITETKSSGKSGDRETTGTSVSKAKRREPVQQSIPYEVPHYMPGNEQLLHAASLLMGAKPGYRAVGEFGEVYSEQLQRLEDEPWGLKCIGDRKRKTFHEAMAALPFYRRPTQDELPLMLSLEFTRRLSNSSSNGHSSHSTTHSPSKPTKALLDVLRSTGRKRDAR